MRINQCKCCQSIFRERIHQLAISGMNPEQIYRYLQSLQDPEEQAIVQREDIKPSSIRRHLDRHFEREEEVKIQVSEVKDRLKTNREKFQNGITVVVDKVNSLCYMIDNALNKIEEVETDDTLNNKTKYQTTIAFMNTVRGLIESLAKLTGELQQEGTIDINFFSNEISVFADIVLESIREVDKTLNLEGKIEEQFSIEFQKKWKDYKDLQTAIINGEVKGRKQNLVSNFNDGV